MGEYILKLIKMFLISVAGGVVLTLSVFIIVNMDEPISNLIGLGNNKSTCNTECDKIIKQSIDLRDK